VKTFAMERTSAVKLTFAIEQIVDVMENVAMDILSSFENYNFHCLVSLSIRQKGKNQEQLYVADLLAFYGLTIHHESHQVELLLFGSNQV
jgi:hypothetical protein